MLAALGPGPGPGALTGSLLLPQSKPESSELVSPKTTDDIVQEKGEEGQRAGRRRHKTENVKQQWSQDGAVGVELEQAQRWVAAESVQADAFSRFLSLCRKEISQLEEGDAGTLHPMFQLTCCLWMTYMEKLGEFLLKAPPPHLGRKLPGLSPSVLSVCRLPVRPAMQRRHRRPLSAALRPGGDRQLGQFVGR